MIPMKSNVLKISQYLNNQNFANKNQGLLNGNIGISIFLYHLARATHIKEIEIMADNLLDKTISCLSNIHSADFEDGVSGIGWGMEYLIQNRFAEGKIDGIFEDIDTIVFQTLNNTSLNSFEMTNGLIGYQLYLNIRLKNSHDIQSISYRINKELLIHLINKLDMLITIQFPLIVKEQNFDLYWRFPLMLHALIESYQLNIYNRKIEQMIKNWISCFEAYIPSLQINRLYLGLILSKLNCIFKSNRIEKQVQILLFSINFDEISTEFNSNYYGMRFGLPGVALIVHQSAKFISPNFPQFKLITKTQDKLRESLRKSESTLFHDQILSSLLQNPGISSGLAGLGLMYLLWPEVFS